MIHSDIRKSWFSITSVIILLGVCAFNIGKSPDDIAGILTPLSLLIIVLPPVGAFMYPVLWKLTKMKVFAPCDYVTGEYSFFSKETFLKFTKVPQPIAGSLENDSENQVDMGVSTAAGVGSIEGSLIMSTIRRENWTINQGKKGVFNFNINRQTKRLTFSTAGFSVYRDCTDVELASNNLTLWESTNSRIVSTKAFVIHVVDPNEIFDRLDKKHLKICECRYLIISGFDQALSSFLGLFAWVSASMGLILSFYLSNSGKYKKSIWGLIPVFVVGLIHLIYIVFSLVSNKANRVTVKDCQTESSVLQGNYLSKLEGGQSDLVWCDPFGRKRLVGPECIYTFGDSLHDSINPLYRIHEELQLVGDLKDEDNKYVIERLGVRTFILKNHIFCRFNFHKENGVDFVELFYGLKSEEIKYGDFNLGDMADFDQRMKSFIKFSYLTNKRKFTTVLDSQPREGVYHAKNVKQIIDQFFLNGNVTFQTQINEYRVKKLNIIVEGLKEVIHVNGEEMFIYDSVKAVSAGEIDKVIGHNLLFFGGKINFKALKSCFTTLTPYNKGACGSSAFKKYTTDLKFLFGGSCLKGMLKCCCFRGKPSHSALEVTNLVKSFEFTLIDTVEKYKPCRDIFEIMKGVSKTIPSTPIIRMGPTGEFMGIEGTTNVLGEGEDNSGDSTVVKESRKELMSILYRKEHLEPDKLKIADNLRIHEGKIVLKESFSKLNKQYNSESMEKFNDWVKRVSELVVDSGFDYRKFNTLKGTDTNYLAADLNSLEKIKLKFLSSEFLQKAKSKIVRKSVRSYLKNDNEKTLSQAINVLTTPKTNALLIETVKSCYYPALSKAQQSIFEGKMGGPKKQASRAGRQGIKRKKGSLDKAKSVRLQSFKKLNQVVSVLKSPDVFNEFITKICEKNCKAAKRILSKGSYVTKEERRIINLVISKIEIEAFGVCLGKIQYNLNETQKLAKIKMRKKKKKTAGGMHSRGGDYESYLYSCDTDYF